MSRLAALCLLTVCFGPIVLAARAAEETTYKLTDANGRPVAAARVSLLGRTGSTATAPDGTFRLEGAPAPPFEIAVTDASGAWLGIVRVDAAGGARLVLLQLPPPRAAEVVVSGVAPSTPAPPAAAASLVVREDIEERRPARLADTLDEVPGSGRIEEGQSAVPTLRGLARGRTLILMDDGRVTAERRAGPSAGFMDPFSVENVEVVRGPGSVLYGSDALGGMIHVKTPMPRPEALAGRFELAAGNGPEQAGIGLEANVPAGPGAVLLQYHQRSWRDYDAPGGATIDNAAARDRGGLVRMLIPVEGARLWAGFQFGQGRDIGKPATDSNVTRAYYPTEDSKRFTLGADIANVLGFASEVRGFFGTYRLVTDRVRIPTPAVTRRIARADVDADDASLRLLGRRPLGNGFLRVGLEGNSRFNLHARNESVDFDAADQEILSVSEIAVGNAYRTDLAAFAEADQTFFQGRLAASAGIRGDTVTTKNTGGYYGDRETSNGAFSGFAALTFTPVAGTSVTAQYAHGFRDPLLSDRYFRGVSGRGFVVGNPDLAPEKSDQYDLAVRSRFGPVYAAAYGYFYRVHDLVERYRDGDNFYFRNRGTEEIRGAELEASVRLSGAISAGVFGTLISGKILDDGSPAGDIPANNIGLSVDAQPLKNLWVRARFAAYQRDDDFGPTETATPGYCVFDLSAGYRFLEALEVRVVGRNLFDKEYPATSDALSVVAPGRNVTVVLAGRF